MLPENLSIGYKPQRTAEQSAQENENLQIRVEEERPDIFRQVILYVLDKVGDKPHVGETVLHKLFYFIDFDYYEKFEENLMGETYIKGSYGPTSVNLVQILNCMEKEGEIEKTEREYHNYIQRKYLVTKHPNPDMLLARDIEHIDELLARLSDKSATEISEYAHNDIPWKCAQFDKPIPYESVFYRDDKYSVKEYDDELLLFKSNCTCGLFPMC